MSGASATASIKRILAVDDEAVVTAMIARTLSRSGMKVACCESAEAALAKLDAENFDLILLDICLPGITGFQALEIMRDKTQAPILLMTGQAYEDIKKDAELLGAAGVLEKPFDLEALLAATEKALGEPNP